MKTSIKMLCLATLCFSTFYSCEEPKQPNPIVIPDNPPTPDPIPDPKPNPEPEPPKTVLEKITDDMIDENGNLNIPDEILEIAANVAINNTQIVSINAKNVKKIGAKAFEKNTSLKTINLPNLIELSADAFANCPSIIKVDLPMLETIGERAFLDCMGIDEVKIPAVKTIRERAFYGLNKKFNMHMGKDAPTVATNVFENTSILKRLHVPAESQEQYKVIAREGNFLYLNETIIPEYTKTPDGTEIDGDVLESLPENINKINFTLSPAIRVIGDGAAFERTYLQGKFAALGVEEIKEYAFKFCSNLLSIEFPSVTKIGEGAFSDCTRLETIVIPNVEIIGKSAFALCYRFTSISLPKIKSIGDNAFDGCDKLAVIELGLEPPTIGKNVFKNRRGQLINVTIKVPAESKDKYDEWKTKNNLSYITIAVKD